MMTVIETLLCLLGATTKLMIIHVKGLPDQGYAMNCKFEVAVILLSMEFGENILFFVKRTFVVFEIFYVRCMYI